MEEFEIKNGVLIKYHEIEGKNNVTVPNEITKIKEFAFLNCLSLKKLILLSRIRKIGHQAFKNCENLTSITLPKNIKIGYNAFYGCTNLINVNANEQVFNKLCYDDQYLIISNFIRQYNNNNIYTEDDINKYIKFILLTKKQLLQMIETVIQDIQKYGSSWFENSIEEYLSRILQNKPLLYFMCNNMDNAFISTEIDELIKLSVKIGEVETTALLLEYKDKHFGYTNPLDEYNLDDNKTK